MGLSVAVNSNSFDDFYLVSESLYWMVLMRCKRMMWRRHTECGVALGHYYLCDVAWLCVVTHLRYAEKSTGSWVWVVAVGQCRAWWHALCGCRVVWHDGKWSKLVAGHRLLGSGLNGDMNQFLVTLMRVSDKRNDIFWWESEKIKILIKNKFDQLIWSI